MIKQGSSQRTASIIITMGRSLPKRAVTKTFKEGFLSSSCSYTWHSLPIRLDPTHSPIRLDPTHPGLCLPYLPDMQTLQGKRGTLDSHFLLPLPVVYHSWINQTEQKLCDLMVIDGPMGKAYVLTCVLYIFRNGIPFFRGGEDKTHTAGRSTSGDSPKDLLVSSLSLIPSVYNSQGA